MGGVEPECRYSLMPTCRYTGAIDKHTKNILIYSGFIYKVHSYAIIVIFFSSSDHYSERS